MLHHALSSLHGHGIRSIRRSPQISEESSTRSTNYANIPRVPSFVSSCCTHYFQYEKVVEEYRTNLERSYIMSLNRDPHPFMTQADVMSSSTLSDGAISLPLSMHSSTISNRRGNFEVGEKWEVHGDFSRIAQPLNIITHISSLLQATLYGFPCSQPLFNKSVELGIERVDETP